MKQVKSHKITAELFSPFGIFYNFDEKKDFPLTGDGFKFYPDRIVADSVTRIGFSMLTVQRKTPRIINTAEYHRTTWEIVIPLNDDAIIHVSPASVGSIETDNVQAFIVPAKTIVKINTGIWHLAPLPINKEELQALIILPETTYMNDCVIEKLDDENSFEITV